MQNDNQKFRNDFKKRLYSFVLDLIKFITVLDKNIVNEVIVKQLLRSGTSIIANYAESSAASSKKDFINFFSYSLKSANESKVWLALLRDTQNIKNQGKLKWLINELQEISNILASSILTMKGKK